MRARKQNRKEERTRRLPIGTHRMKLTVPEIKGYRVRWVLDRDNRPMDFMDYGYEFVTTDEVPGAGEARQTEINDSLGSRVVKRSGPDTLILMKISEKEYQINQKAKNAELDLVDEEIYTGKRFEVDKQYGSVKAK